MLKFVTGWLLLITMNTQATDWPLYGLGHDNRRFSGLRQINRDNVQRRGAGGISPTGHYSVTIISVLCGERVTSDDKAMEQHIAASFLNNS